MSRAKGLFITGTDTGVGKTRVTAILAVALASARIACRRNEASRDGVFDGE